MLSVETDTFGHIKRDKYEKNKILIKMFQSILLIDYVELDSL